VKKCAVAEEMILAILVVAKIRIVLMFVTKLLTSTAVTLQIASLFAITSMDLEVITMIAYLDALAHLLLKSVIHVVLEIIIVKTLVVIRAISSTTVA
jgi:hypothetical protein